MRIRRMTAPPVVREVDERIAEVRLKKESAIDAQDFERAARLRDQERQLLEEKANREREWKSGEMDVLAEIDEEEIAEVLSVWTGIPVYKLTEEETQKLLRMEDELHKRIVDQSEAVVAVSRAIRRTRAGLKDPRRPSGSFIFLGPSGVGKTELSKTLAEFLFGDEIRADPARHVRVHGEAHGLAADRFAAGLRRLRGGRPAHRARPAQAVQRDPVRRDREGAPGRVQRAAADPRGRAPDRRAGPPGRLQERGRDHDVEPRHPGHPEGPGDRVRHRRRRRRCPTRR